MFVTKLKILFFIFIFTSFSYSQSIYFCESYTEDGIPVGTMNKLEIKPYGAAVYILINNENEFEDPILFLFVDKLIDGNFSPLDSKTLSVKKDDTWAVTSFEFKETGIYEVYFLNSSQTRLATGKIEVTYSNGAQFNKIPPVSSQKFGESEFVFCELVVDGKPINTFTSLSLSRSDGQAFIYLDNYYPFGYDRINVQIWKRSKQNSNNEELVDTKKYKILPEWSDTFFRYNFNSIGEYKIDIFDKNNNFIASNILTVTN